MQDSISKRSIWLPFPSAQTFPQGIKLADILRFACLLSAPYPAPFKRQGHPAKKRDTPKLFASRPQPHTGTMYLLPKSKHLPSQPPSLFGQSTSHLPCLTHSYIRSFRHWDSAAHRSQAQGLYLSTPTLFCHQAQHPFPYCTHPIDPRTNTVPFVPPSFHRASYLPPLSFSQHHLHSHRGS